MMRVFNFRHAVASTAFLIACVSNVAFAEDTLVTRARDEFNEANFEAAEDTLNRALLASTLTTLDLVEIYRLRALINFASGDLGAAEKSLRALLSVDPEYTLDQEVAPPLQKTFRRLRRDMLGAMSLEHRATPMPDGVRVEFKVQNDPERIVKRIVHFHRQLGEEEWQKGEGSVLTAPVGLGGTIEYYAVAYGPGSSELAHAGFFDDPASASRSAGAYVPTEGGGGTPASSGPIWPWIVGAAALVVATIVVVVLIAASSNPGTQLSPPMPAP